MMKRPLVILIVAVTLAGLIALALGASQYTSDDLGALLILLVLGVLAERYAAGLFHSHISIGVVAVLAAGVIADAWGVALVAPVIVVAGQVGTDAVWYKRLYNGAVYLLAGVAFAATFHAFGDLAQPDRWPEVALPAAAGALTNVFVNSGLVAAAISLSEGESFLVSWRRFRWVFPYAVLLGLVATAAAAAYAVLGIWGLLVFAAPAASVRQAYLHRAASEARDGRELRRAA